MTAAALFGVLFRSDGLALVGAGEKALEGTAAQGRTSYGRDGEVQC
jgi:hypothetical protein